MRYIGVTSMMLFNTCRRQFDLEKLQRLEPDRPAVHFFLGSAVHAFLEELYRGWKADASDGESAENAFDVLDDLYAEESALLHKEFGTFAEGYADELFDAYSLAHDMCDHYLVAKAPADRERWEILDVELGVSYEFAPGLTLRGKIDLVVKDRTNGRILIIDHKTSKYGHKDGAPGLDIDEQITAYAWLYQQQTGISPNAYMYHMFIKKVPGKEEPPLIRKGKALTQRKNNIAWTADVYGRAIKENDFALEDYVEYLEFLENIDYVSECFDSIYVYRTDAALDNFERRLHMLGGHMQQAIDNPKLLYPNPSTFRCGRCSVLPICVAMENDENVPAIVQASFRMRS